MKYLGKFNKMCTASEEELQNCDEQNQRRTK